MLDDPSLAQQERQHRPQLLWRCLRGFEYRERAYGVHRYALVDRYERLRLPSYRMSQRQLGRRL